MGLRGVPARRSANGRIGLRFTTGGFGTPFFGDDEQVRIEGDRIVRQAGGRAREEPLTTLAAAAALALDGPPDLAWAEGSDVPPAGDPRATLGLDPVAARLLGDRYGFAWSALEELRADPARGRAGGSSSGPSTLTRPTWVPKGRGARPTAPRSGDADVDEPYLYVLPSVPEAAPGGGLWNAAAFHGAILPLGAFVGATDQRAAALAFFRERRDALAA